MLLTKLREALGLLSGYKQKYDEQEVELDNAKAELAEASQIAEEIVALLKGWDASK